MKYQPLNLQILFPVICKHPTLLILKTKHGRTFQHYFGISRRHKMLRRPIKLDKNLPSPRPILFTINLVFQNLAQSWDEVFKAVFVAVCDCIELETDKSKILKGLHLMLATATKCHAGI